MDPGSPLFATIISCKYIFNFYFTELSLYMPDIKGKFNNFCSAIFGQLSLIIV